MSSPSSSWNLNAREFVPSFPSSSTTTTTSNSANTTNRSSTNSNSNNGNKKKGVATSELIHFHYERSANIVSSNSLPHHSHGNGGGGARKGSRSNHKSRVHSLTKAEYMQANPFTNPLEAAWFDAQELIPWDAIECVIAPINQENNLLCPICLDLVHIPKITKCGHAYCVTCILRHMKCDRSNRLKCPTCMELIYEKDLKAVKFQETTFVSSIDSVEQSTSSSSTSKQPRLAENENYSFQHLVVPKGKVSPSFHHDLSSYANKSTQPKKISNHVKEQQFVDQLQRLYEVIPCEQEEISKYGRIVFRDITALFTQLNLERQQLLALRQQATNLHLIQIGEVDMEALPYIDDALELIRRHEEEIDFALAVFQLNRSDAMLLCDAFCQQQVLLSQKNAAKSSVVVDSDNAPSSNQVKTPKQAGSRTASVSSTMAVSQDSFFNDDEYDLQLALAMSESLQVGSITNEHPQQHITNNANNGNTVVEDNMIQHLFQCTSGAWIFLHPMCTQCILQHYQQLHEDIPMFITGRILEIERVRLGEGKSKYQFLKHLPIYTEVYVIEIDMRPLVNKSIVQQHSEEIQRRMNKRKERKKVEHREKKLEEQQRIKEEVRRQERLAYYNELRQQELADIQAVQHGPTVKEANHHNSSCEDKEQQEENGEIETVEVTEPVAITAAASTISFREITQMGGNFPSLNAPSSQSTATPPLPPGKTVGAWGVAVPTRPPALIAGTSTNQSSEPFQPIVIKKGKKTKISLLSNASSRAY